MKRCLLLVLAAAVVLLAGGCDTVREAWEESMNSSARGGDWFGEAYKPRYLFALYAPVKYPRGLRELERQIVTLEGKRLWINTNQFFSSRHVQEIRKMPRTDVPGAYDLALKLSDSGVRIWTMLSQQFSHEPMIMLIDQVVFVSAGYSGAEGSRTPVRRPEDQSISERSLCIGIPAAGLPQTGSRHW